MKTQIITIAAILLLVTIISGTDIYAGDSYSFPTEQFEYYDVIGNSSSIQGLEVNWENGNTTITFDNTYKSDTFTIILFNEIEVIKEINVGGGSSGGSGGGTRTIYKDRNITKYETIAIDNPVEKEVIKVETQEVEKIVNRFPVWAWVLICLVVFGTIITLIYLILREGY